MTQLQFVSAPETLAYPQLAHRFLVELVSTKCELDSNDVPVPIQTKLVDVCVIEASKQAIRTLLEASGHLAGFEIKSYWTPIDGCPF